MYITFSITTDTVTTFTTMEFVLILSRCANVVWQFEPMQISGRYYVAHYMTCHNKKELNIIAIISKRRNDYGNKM